MLAFFCGATCGRTGQAHEGRTDQLQENRFLLVHQRHLQTALVALAASVLLVAVSGIPALWLLPLLALLCPKDRASGRLLPCMRARRQVERRLSMAADGSDAPAQPVRRFEQVRSFN
jgi:hypothetical protein